MGWSEKTRQLKVKKVLDRHGMKFSVTKIDTAEPTVRININQSESKLPPNSMKEVEALFPDNVYVLWVFDVQFSEQENQEIQEVKAEPEEETEVAVDIPQPTEKGIVPEDSISKGMDFESKL